MHALVTGGGGFLGRYIVEQLIRRGGRVRTFSRRCYPDLESLGVEQQQGSLTDRERVLAACRGVDVVFHTAAVPGVWGPWRMFYETNTLGTEHVIAACRAQGVPKLVFTSSPSVVFDGQPHEGADESLPYPPRYNCPYPETKALAERAVLTANSNDLATVALRPHLIWGPRDPHLVPRIIQRGKQGRLVRVGDGTNRVSVSYVENVSHAHLLACDALKPGSLVAGRAYFINEPEPVSLWGFVDGLLQRTGLRGPTRSISLKSALRIGAALETTYRALRLRGEPRLTRFVAQQLGTSHWYRIDAASRDFGYRPLVTMDEGLQRMDEDLRRWAAGA